jgi:uncharacterized heparinase superfamily protein
MLFGTPIVGGPHNVMVEREDTQAGALLRTSHDGYANDFGVIHHRSIAISADGRTLDGEDNFLPSDGLSLPANTADEYAIRFHLHPAIKASRLSDGRGVILLLPDREVWTFATLASAVEIEESVFLAGTDGPRRAVQIVIYGHAREHAKVKWSFGHTPPAAPGSRPVRADEPELPL